VSFLFLKEGISREKDRKEKRKGGSGQIENDMHMV
jgi:hypothetical protein